MLSPISRVLPALVLAIVLAACGDSPTSPNNADYSQSDLRVGTGADALTGRVVTVNYTGWFYNASAPEGKGVQFDSSVGQTPFSFTLGAGQVIRGWEQGVQGMKVGGIRRLVIPPSLAYGQSRYGPIPPNATLVFEIELVEVS
ncbi:MAG: FKBP-type peptidyl-prolyl cis-trans isomerase [Vicinamibacterales bacterium]